MKTKEEIKKILIENNYGEVGYCEEFYTYKGRVIEQDSFHIDFLSFGIDTPVRWRCYFFQDNLLTLRVL